MPGRYSTVDDIKEYYLRNIELYGIDAPRTMGYHQGPIDARLIQPLLPERLSSAYSVLDVGCGLGQLIPVLSATFPDATLSRFVGIDLVPEFVARCRDAYPMHEFHDVDFLDWRSDERFELVIAAGVFVNRIADYERYLSACISRMVGLTRRYIGFNVVGDQSERYTAKHLVSISEPRLRGILHRFPQVRWSIEIREAFPGSSDLFVRGELSS